MGYFDSVKDRPVSTVPASSNVVQLRDEIHPYAQAIRAAWLTRLDNLARPWVQGAAWDSNCFVTARKLIEVANSPWAGYSIADAHADYLAHAPRDNVWDKREKCWVQAFDRAIAQALPEPPPNATIPDVTILDLVDDRREVVDLTPDQELEFWHSRDYLHHIHTYARARRVSPWATLGVVLARVVTATPWHVVLPPIVGGVASLNLFVGLIGRSGSGKGAAESVAAECFDVGFIETHKTGSGEGIAHGYRKRIRNDIEWVNEKHAVLFSIPEIDTLAALGNRQGATLMPELRSAWSGERLGFGYADPTKRLPVPAHEYRLCLVAGIQPGRAQALLDNTDGGTPQRFLWLPAYDPDAPTVAPDCPEPLTWNPPNTSTKIKGSMFTTIPTQLRMDVAQVARDTIDQARLDRLRGSGEALDGHGLLTRLKVAAALALADQRLTVNDEDWELAGVIHRKSDATRAGVQHDLAYANEERNTARATAEAKRTLIVGEQVDEAKVKKVSRALVRHLRKADDWSPSSAVRRALRSNSRAWFEDAVGRLLETGEVEVEETDNGARYRLTEKARNDV